jgi:PAS domain S-box-containing protein
VIVVDTSASVISYNGKTALCAVSRDVTERKRFEEVRTRLARQAELRADVSAALTESGALRGILQRCAEAMVRHLDAAFARVWTLNEEEDMLELQASAGMYSHLDGPHSRVPVGKYKIGLIARERRPHLTNGVVNDPRVSDKEWARREGMVAFAGYPLLVEDRLVGVIAMFAREELAEDVIEALGSVADIIAQGIERKRIEEALYRSEERFRSLVQNASDIITLLEADATVRYVSPAIEQILGYRPEERWGHSTFELIHPDDVPKAKATFAESLKNPGAILSTELRMRHRDGSWRHIEVTGTNLLGDPSVNGIVINSRDITERKRAEEETKEANRRLEDLAVLKADFTAMVAHELDTPLAVIRGYADMLATGELDPAGRERALAKIQTETDVMAALIADARHAAAIEREDFAVKPRRVPIGALIKDAVAFAETLCENNPLVIKNDVDGQEVWADLYRIGQVLRNLLSNAAKYSPDGAPIELRMMPGDTPGHVRIEVADQGVGVHPDDVNRIFEKFGRGRDRSGRKVAGVGLGLYLSRRILQAHGGDLTLAPAPGGGSVFGFELEAA